jgi:hypothetical protein
MFEVIDKFTKYFTWDKTDVDNWNFKLYSKVSVALCMLAAATCICTEYFGKSIDCFQEQDNKYATQYCWLHGTYQFASTQKDFVEQLAKKTGQKCVTDDYYSKNEVPQTAYYQWVIFMLFGHGCLFMLPDWIWKFIEGGLIENFGPFKEPVNGDGDKLRKNADKFINLSQNQNRLYFIGFVTCELMNLGVAVLNVIVIDVFLNGKFLWYGYDVIQYLIRDKYDEFGDYDGSSETVNPMCAAFPTLVNCEYFLGGVGVSRLDTRSAVCILSQNIVNEKIYLILWFWHIFLIGSSTFMLGYRFITTLIPHFRQYELFFRARKGRSKVIEEVSKRIALSQWFILCQIGRNHSDSRMFNDLLKKIESQHTENNNNQYKPLNKKDKKETV